MPDFGAKRHHHASGEAVKRVNMASELRDIVADDALAVGLGVPFAWVEGRTQRERINRSLNERNWT